MLEAKVFKNLVILFAGISCIIFSGCSRLISMNEVRKYESEWTKTSQAQWIYRDTIGEYHYFIRFYENNFGGTAYESVKISSKELIIKITQIFPNGMNENENGNEFKSIIPK